MARNVTQYCHVCKSQTTSGPPVYSPDWIAALDALKGDIMEGICVLLFINITEGLNLDSVTKINLSRGEGRLSQTDPCSLLGS